MKKVETLIPLVPERLISNLASGIEDGFDSECEQAANEIFASGIISMESQLLITDGLLNEFVVDEKTSLWELLCTIPLGVLPTVSIWGSIILLSYFNQEALDRIISAHWIMQILSIVAVIYLIFVLPPTSFNKVSDYLYDRRNRRYRITVKDGAIQNADCFLIDHCLTKEAMSKLKGREVIPRFRQSVHLERICRQLDLDHRILKVDLRKAKGGNSTYVGWGSGGMIAAGIGLSVISGFGTWAKNGFVNQRITVIENLLFFNNVADSFNNSEIALDGEVDGHILN